MNPSEAKKMLLTTDFPIDMVIYRSPVIPVSVLAYDWFDTTLTHSNGGLFLPVSQYCLSSDFSTEIYDVGTSPSVGGSESYNTAVSASSTDLYLYVNNNTSSAVTLYFRVVGLAVPDDGRNVTETAQYQTLVLNTDNNYMKILDQDVLTLSTGASAPIPHTLGEVPVVLAWSDLNLTGFVSQIPFVAKDFVYSDYGVVVSVNSSELTVVNATLYDVRFYYKLYIGY